MLQTAPPVRVRRLLQALGCCIGSYIAACQTIRFAQCLQAKGVWGAMERKTYVSSTSLIGGSPSVLLILGQEVVSTLHVADWISDERSSAATTASNSTSSAVVGTRMAASSTCSSLSESVSTSLTG